MIDTILGERVELNPETVVLSSSDDFNFYKRFAWYVPFPISRPGFGKLPTRQYMSSLWSPSLLFLNTQLRRVSPYV